MFNRKNKIIKQLQEQTDKNLNEMINMQKEINILKISDEAWARTTNILLIRLIELDKMYKDACNYILESIKNKPTKK